MEGIDFIITGDKGANIIKSAFLLLTKQFPCYNHLLHNDMKIYEKNDANKNKYQEIIDSIEKCSRTTIKIKNILKIRELFD